MGVGAWVCGCGFGCVGVGVGLLMLMYFLMKGIQVVQWTETAAWKCIISPQQGGSTGFLFHCKQWNISQCFIRSRPFWDTIRNLPDWDQHAPIWLYPTPPLSPSKSVNIRFVQCLMLSLGSFFYFPIGVTGKSFVYSTLFISNMEKKERKTGKSITQVTQRSLKRASWCRNRVNILTPGDVVPRTRLLSGTAYFKTEKQDIHSVYLCLSDTEPA